MKEPIPENKIEDHVDAFFNALECEADIATRLSVLEDPECAVYIVRLGGWAIGRVNCLAVAIDTNGFSHVLMPDARVLCFQKGEVL